jgi:hypothetical protein
MPRPVFVKTPAHWLLAEGPVATIMITSPSVEKLLELWPGLPLPGVISCGVVCYYGGLDSMDYKNICLYGRYSRSPVITVPLVRGFYFPVGISEPQPMSVNGLMGIPVESFGDVGPDFVYDAGDKVHVTIHWKAHPNTPKALVPTKDGDKTVLLSTN